MLAHDRKGHIKIIILSHKKSSKNCKDLLASNNFNKDLFDECQQESIETTIARRRWRWIGYILRKDQGSISRVAVEWKPAEATAMGHSWGTLRTLAQDRLRWREFVAALVVYDKKGSN